MAEQHSMHEEELLRVIEQLVESLLEASDQELLKEVREDGQDPAVVAQAVSRVIANARKQHGMRAREHAKEEYKRQVSSLSGRQSNLPRERDEQLRLLAAALKVTPDLDGLVTIAYRDFTDLRDSDLESLLHQLADLGLLPDTPDSGRGSGGA